MRLTCTIVNAEKILLSGGMMEEVDVIRVMSLYRNL